MLWCLFCVMPTTFQFPLSRGNKEVIKLWGCKKCGRVFVVLFPHFNVVNVTYSELVKCYGADPDARYEEFYAKIYDKIILPRVVIRAIKEPVVF